MQTKALTLLIACIGVGFSQTQNNTPTGVVDAHAVQWVAPYSAFGSLPSTPLTGTTYMVTDASAAGTCAGGGSARTLCRWTGSVWEAIGGGSGGGVAIGYTSLINGATTYTNPEPCVTYSSTVTTDFGGQSATSYALKLFTAPALWDGRSFRIEETTAITASGTTGGAAVTALYGCIGSLTVPCGYKSAFPLMGASSPAFAASSGGTTLASTVNGTQDVYLSIANASVTPTGFLSNITAGVVKVRVCGVTLQ